MSLMRRLNNNAPTAGASTSAPTAAPGGGSMGGGPTPPPREPVGNGQTTGTLGGLTTGLKRPVLGKEQSAAAATRERNDSFTELKTRVQNRLIAELDPRMDLSNAEEVRRTVEDTFNRVLEQEQIVLTRVERLRLFEAIAAEILGYGPIEPLLKDDTVSEVMVNGPRQVYVERRGKLELSGVQFQDDDHVMRVIDRIVSPLGRRIDESSPTVDARLPDGSRINAVIPPISLVGPVLTIRKFSKDPLTIDDLVRFGTVTPEMVAFLKACVEARLNVVVAGGTGSGKTTTLNVLSSFIPEDERIITIENAAELQLRQEHVVTLESRPANIEGKGEVTIRDLVINSLRMRPERIVVGECRGGEALDMLQAMNTGHDGRLGADTRVHFTDGTRRVAEWVDELLTAYPERIERRDRHGIAVEYIVVPRERAATVTCIKVDGRAMPTPVVYALRSRHTGTMLRIRTASGLEHTVSPEHPLYALRDAIDYVPAGGVSIGDWLAAPRRVVRADLATVGDDEESYWAGMIVGDGSIAWRVTAGGERRARDVSLDIDDDSIAAGFAAYLTRAFGAGSRATRRDDPSAGAPGRWPIGNSTAVATAVAERYALPTDGLTRATGLDDRALADSPRHFLAGFFDAGGHIGIAERGTRDALALSSGNRGYLAVAREALLIEGIPARLRHVAPGRATEPTWQLVVTGRDAIRRFAERIPLRHARKRAALRALSERLEGVVGNPNADVIPCTERLKRYLNEAKEHGHSQRAIAARAGVSQSLVSAYRRGARLPTPGRLEQLCLALGALGVGCDDLLLLARADLRWERVVAVEPIEYDGHVYDLQVSEEHHSGLLPHNFAADCLLTSNSMTTAHANTPRDTLSRLETMCLMAGIDLPVRAIREQIAAAVDVIVQQSRLKDGSRRITAVTEVQGMEGDVIVMQDIFIFEQTGIENGKIVGRMKPTGIRPKFIEKFEVANIYLPPNIFGAMDRFF
jgi:pilus assembly protein CpaF